MQSPAAGSLLCHVCNELAGLSLLQPRKMGQLTSIGVTKEKNSLESGLSLTYKDAWPPVWRSVQHRRWVSYFPTFIVH